MTILIKNGTVIDPSQDINGQMDIVVKGRKIQGIYPKGKGTGSEKTIDATDCIVIPGLVDMHTHLREPGFEYKETIKTGTLAAVRGGFTAVCCMPNTDPINDSISVTELILERSKQGSCDVFPIGAITIASESESLTELEALIKAGCVAFSDDGMPVTNSLLMRRALEYSKIFNVPVIAHCEDMKLSEGGAMNEGFVSTILGLPGIPKAAEETMVARDLSLCELTGGRLHIAHVSTEGSVNLLRDAKKRGINVTAETCPHYFSLTDETLISYDTNLKVNPPIRAASDRDAIKEGLRDGTIDVIATDHAPHHFDDKNKEFDNAAFGISGLETAFALSYQLVELGIIDLSQLVKLMCLTPSNIMGFSKGTLKDNSDADITVININNKYKVDSSKFLSKGKNSPFNKWTLKGTIEKTIVKGKVYDWKEIR
ncbi:dihydroorotase [bacterium BMS3Abin09]|nr:dihydroorotase [bacterium BMS3Abin09]HDH34759.1 dihydroorotase [Nitrospirota bacterium]